MFSVKNKRLLSCKSRISSTSPSSSINPLRFDPVSPSEFSKRQVFSSIQVLSSFNLKAESNSEMARGNGFQFEMEVAPPKLMVVTREKVKRQLDTIPEEDDVELIQAATPLDLDDDERRDGGN
ncbi:hypothetical protein FCM35_KLT10045 [Carex littledalei]|uniref:Uncharacterized protein n=1 Tax=Carex littledalei TaxID=544730 RepID=A0A833VKN6_9POAL|nr:hypothetical protein FCM35_KLT10045 [Carex littledalei]